jgi:hypothetical protein
MLAIPMMPLQIVLPWGISRFTSGPRPMDVYLKASALCRAGLSYIQCCGSGKFFPYPGSNNKISKHKFFKILKLFLFLNRYRRRKI